jgi:hypothetical protein
MMMYKRRSVRKNNATNVYITTRVIKKIQKYKESRRNTKKAVSEARSQAYTELYRKLDMKEGENIIYKMAKLLEIKTRDFI